MKDSRSKNSSKQQDTQKLFLEMYDSFNDEIFRFCMSKTRNRDESLDITQETFVKTWDYLRLGNTIDMARAFLYRIARNLIIDHARKKKSVSLDAMFESPYGETSGGHGDSGSAFDAPDYEHIPSGDAQDRAQMIERLKQLPEHSYEILVMRFIQELTISEIAKIYKESENAISVRIHRAIKLAQKLFPTDSEEYQQMYEQ